MSKLSLRTAGVFLCCVGWVYACSGSAFNAAGGGGSSGSSAAAGAAQNGGASAGGVSAGGASAGGASAGGTSKGGRNGGGAGRSAGGDAGQGGDVGAAGAGEAGAPAGGGVNGGASGSAGATSVGGAAGTAGVLNSGDCLVDKDCGTGNQCVALAVGGFRTCVTPVPPPTTCTSMLDECCPTDAAKACATGKACVRAPLGPSCGGAVAIADNVCAASQCMANADCTGNNAICVPAGALDRKINTCITGGCRRDAECKDSAGGKCEPVTTNCCNGPSGLYCVYPGKGCRSNADCGVGSTCQVSDSKTSQCVSGASVCPG